MALWPTAGRLRAHRADPGDEGVDVGERDVVVAVAVAVEPRTRGVRPGRLATEGLDEQVDVGKGDRTVAVHVARAAHERARVGRARRAGALPCAGAIRLCYERARAVREAARALRLRTRVRRTRRPETLVCAARLRAERRFLQLAMPIGEAAGPGFAFIGNPIAVDALQIPWAQRPWFWLLQGLPVLVWLAGVVWRKRCDELERNPRLRRERMVRRLLREWLAELDRLAAANEADEFFALLFRILQEQLGERLDLPASAITEAVIDEQLRPRGVPEETLERLQELFRECDQARFAPAHSRKMLGDLAPKVELVIGELRALPDPQPRGGS